MRAAFDALPGGTNVMQTPQSAYVWCHYDPVNFADPNGHSAGEVFGMIYSIISFFLWQMQVTSIALQMALLNFVIMIIPSIIDLIVSAASDEPLWGVNIFNAISAAGGVVPPDGAVGLPAQQPVQRERLSLHNGVGHLDARIAEPRPRRILQA